MNSYKVPLGLYVLLNEILVSLKSIKEKSILIIERRFKLLIMTHIAF